LQLLTVKPSKRLQTTQALLQEISYAKELNQETSYAQAQLKETSMLKHNFTRLLFKQNYKENCLRLNT